MPRGAFPEAAFRGACSRAYYCAFVVARDLLDPRHHFGYARSVHKDVIRLLKRSQNQAVRAAGGELDELRQRRNWSDYDLGSRSPKQPVDQFLSVAAIAQSDAIVEDLTTCAATDPTLGII